MFAERIALLHTVMAPYLVLQDLARIVIDYAMFKTGEVESLTRYLGDVPARLVSLQDGLYLDQPGCVTKRLDEGTGRWLPSLHVLNLANWNILCAQTGAVELQTIKGRKIYALRATRFDQPLYLMRRKECSLRRRVRHPWHDSFESPIEPHPDVDPLSRARWSSVNSNTIKVVTSTPFSYCVTADWLGQSSYGSFACRITPNWVLCGPCNVIAAHASLQLFDFERKTCIQLGGNGSRVSLPRSQHAASRYKDRMVWVSHEGEYSLYAQLHVLQLVHLHGSPPIPYIESYGLPIVGQFVGDTCVYRDSLFVHVRPHYCSGNLYQHLVSISLASVFDFTQKQG